MTDLILVLAIYGMMTISALTIVYALRLHHSREMRKHDMREEEVKQNFKLMNRALDEGKTLPQPKVRTNQWGN